MYLPKNPPADGSEAAWASLSLQIGDSLDIVCYSKSALTDLAHRELEQHGISLENSVYILLRFECSQIWTACSLMEIAANDMIHDIFDILGQCFSVHLFTSNGALYGILMQGRDAAHGDFRPMVSDCCRRLLARCSGVVYHIILSREESGRHGLFHAMNSLRQGLDYLHFFDRTPYPDICFMDIFRQTALEEMVSYEKVRQLALLCAEEMTGEYFDASAAAERISRMLRECSACSMESLHYQMNNFGVLFINQIECSAVVDRGFIQAHDIYSMIMAGDTDSEHLKFMEKALSCLYGRAQELRKIYDNQQFREIRSYIEQNITQADLSVSQLADMFAMNRSQLTKRFRDYFGQSLAEFIHVKRFERALLLIDTYPARRMEEIAQEAGYYSLSTMYRAFQKHGVGTPAEYRNSRKTR